MCSEDFKKAATDVKNLKSQPPPKELLRLYAYYKQATIGDNDTPKPGLTDVTGKAKWENWNSLKGTSKPDAESQYIAFVKELIGKYGLK